MTNGVQCSFPTYHLYLPLSCACASSQPHLSHCDASTTATAACSLLELKSRACPQLKHFTSTHAPASALAAAAVVSRRQPSKMITVLVSIWPTKLGVASSELG